MQHRARLAALLHGADDKNALRSDKQAWKRRQHQREYIKHAMKFEHGEMPV